ncbi:hypothetical protein P3X46_011145 [Hevea brasiliensis]|uniref:FHA domain-containing protein n=1 Tax=Hevea brasiliensis TaxID=3981 RepID=A0ABQ9MG98_HEVBR|nr:CAX-interacting protein 4 [Hevea brasiliensis]KAJ9179344.1 hypothetical protein P3X46_011145 [Hevea brasiliensis]
MDKEKDRESPCKNDIVFFFNRLTTGFTPFFFLHLPLPTSSVNTQTSQMELEGDDGSTIELKDDSSETVFGRGSGSNTKDRTVSRRHILFHLDKTENHTEPRVSFQVIGKNPLWVRSGGGGKEVKVFRKLERGEMAAGDWFCISSQSPVWFNLKRIGIGEERDFGSVNGSERLGENSESVDLSEIDPVKEFGFLVIGHEFDCYPKQRFRDVKNWYWFLEEPEEDSEDGGSFESNRMKRKGNGRRKRKKGGGNDEDDDDWSGESEEDKETVAKIRKIERSKHSTRSKEKNKPHKDRDRKKDSLQRNTVNDDDDDDADATLGGFIVNDDDVDEEQGGESDKEEEEFIDDEDEDELDD